MHYSTPGSNHTTERQILSEGIPLGRCGACALQFRHYHLPYALYGGILITLLGRHVLHTKLPTPAIITAL